ncbi:hypothetical protein ACMWEF_001585 [Campylobacter jejuni]|uniref:hypothetical protein n=1 Tax=Campylobacter jejuni TaxID=197 RepID=UPI000893C475|nr:hypothetical protein [Campylobacter jejuni]EAJ2975629.1 hypothetical protein [Campylobacter jejuni]ECP7254000.1 hypothetical protein [Campylobacter jejuni]ECP7577848.1 hypothetical protein [Campylobacter jejuni]EDP2897566.1 hypothetical protein [Campylobacter jejuni]EEP3556545.1 hypothetical protein [Campylobacter jejuni]
MITKRIKIFFAISLGVVSLAYADTAPIDKNNNQYAKEADNVILSSSYGKQVIKENNYTINFKENRPDYYAETLFNWVNYYNNSNPRGVDVTGKEIKGMIVAYVSQEQNATNNTDKVDDLAVVKGFCYITNEIFVGKQPGSLRVECQTNVGAVTMFANLVNLNDRASLIVDPKYIEKKGVRFDVKSSIVTNENKTSYNVATFVNDRKLAQIGWEGLSTATQQIQQSTNEYLQALEQSKQKQNVNYVNVSDGAGNSYPQAAVTTNTEKPDPLDYLITGSINVISNVVQNTADIFSADLPYLYYISKDSKIWIDLKVNKQGVYVK